ncbi:putative Co/Zn/Cd efflux system membrane fusion protein [Acidisarcina polymorpha]|uniref:Putative Co/Zn/Cd efflux system membrane fusion protein n=1 Tax=Acidisarcina polymorpha TaxID=2211140 RepID=A0A2Z5G5Q7_9BACT|nr:efflux RND transporter periplasmic adaptor subunit [Acidisarcina polymorpha]AXC14117.1 putative Co/Zn/Cd efflux system membrane fusion protein [Acidisarcina polymorpha]
MPTSKSFHLLLVLIPVVIGMSGCKPQVQPDPRIQPDMVRVVRVGLAQAGEHAFTGVVTARVQSDLGFRVPGKVTKRFVDVGQVVRAGQELMRIDVTDYAHVITTQTQNVEAVKAKAQQASADEARYRGLVSTGAVSASTYDQVKANADAALAQLAAAEAQAQVAKDEGDYSLLLADSDGTVVETLAEPGQVVAAGQTVVKLAHAGPREAAVNLPETVRPALESTARATVYGKTESVEARLRQLSDAADPATRTFEARYVLGGAEAKAPLGATVTIQLPVSAGTSTVEVPVAAITDRGRGPGVWVLNETSSTVSFRPVSVLHLEDEDATLSDGVKPGEEIVALGAHLLNEGQQVRVADEKAAAR